jgi:peptide deformylase
LIGVNDVGLSFGLLCEKNGYEVLVSNSNEDYIFNLNQRICITNEPLIQSMLFDTKNFSATTNNSNVIKNSDIIFIFSPTPSNIEGNYDTTKVFDVISEFYSLSSQDIPLYHKKVVICSTTNPGEVEQIQQRLNMFNIQVAYNPFFTNEGEIVKNIENHEMVLIGGEYQELTNDLIQLHTKLKKVFINAEIIEETGDMWSYEEGCLSIPDVRGDVERFSHVKLRYLDEHFEQREEIFDGMNARVIQHEYDHIEGILFVEHLKPIKKTLIRKRLDKIRNGQIEADYRLKFAVLR